MLNKELEITLNNAFKSAHDKRHEFITVEHLLLALLDNTASAAVLNACKCDISLIREQLTKFINETISLLPHGMHRETQPTLGFQRVLQRAVFHVQATDKKEVTGANLFVALFSEQDSHAVYLLNQQEITRLDVVNYMAHGIGKNDANNVSEDEQLSEQGHGESESGKPLDRFATNLNNEAKEGRIDPLIGRELEVERTIQTLCRRRKNNPLLVGEAGVGKTAIAEGLAKKNCGATGS